MGSTPLRPALAFSIVGHRVVDQLADGRLLGVGLQMRPARLLRHPEHVLGEILVRVFGGGGVFGQQRGALRLEGVRDVLEEDQAERDVLVVGRLEVLAQLVGGEEQLRLEAEVGAVAVPGWVSAFSVFPVAFVLLVLSSVLTPAFHVPGSAICSCSSFWIYIVSEWEEQNLLILVRRGLPYESA